MLILISCILALGAIPIIMTTVLYFYENDYDFTVVVLAVGTKGHVEYKRSLTGCIVWEIVLIE